MSDILWFVLGGLIGYAISWVNRRETTEDSHHADTIKKHEEDIAYYKKLTKTLVEENKELRKKLNDAS